MSPSSRFLLLLAAVLGVGTVVALALDGDEDGMSDDYEQCFGLNTASNDAAGDPDGDWLDNLAESLLWTDPMQADTDRDGWTDDADTNPVSRAVLPWGDSCFTRTNAVMYTWPDWMVAAFKCGGVWDTNPPAWHVDAADTNAASLNIEIDRALLTNDIRVRMGVAGEEATFYLSLYDTNGSVVVSNVAGNILDGSGTVKTISVPLAANQGAVGLAFHRGTGAVSVSESVVYVDIDGDGLDAGQEAQLGTSDSLVDTDGDGFSDPDEAGAGTDPLDSGQHPPHLAGDWQRRGAVRHRPHKCHIAGDAGFNGMRPDGCLLLLGRGRWRHESGGVVRCGLPGHPAGGAGESWREWIVAQHNEFLPLCGHQCRRDWMVDGQHEFCHGEVSLRDAGGL